MRHVARVRISELETEEPSWTRRPKSFSEINPPLAVFQRIMSKSNANQPPSTRKTAITKIHAAEHERSLQVPGKDAPTTLTRVSPDDAMKQLELTTLQEVFESSADSIFIKKPRGKLIYKNKAFRRNFAWYYQSEVHYDDRAVPVDLKSIFRFTDERLIREQSTLKFSYAVSFPDGKTRRFFTTKTSLWGPGDEVNAILGVLREGPAYEAVDPWDSCDFLTMKQAQESFASMAKKKQKAILLACEGYPNKRIASELDISVRSVERYRGQCMNSFGVGSFAKLVRAIHQLNDFGLISFSD